jgi:hypothetical protein
MQRGGARRQLRACCGSVALYQPLQQQLWRLVQCSVVGVAVVHGRERHRICTYRKESGQGAACCCALGPTGWAATALFARRRRLVWGGACVIKLQVLMQGPAPGKHAAFAIGLPASRA